VTNVPDQTLTEVALRAALHEEWETVMNTTATELELRRFQDDIRRRSAGQRVLWAAAGIVLLVGAVGGFVIFRDSTRTAANDFASTGDIGRIEVVYDPTGGHITQPTPTDVAEERGASFIGNITVRVGDTTRSGSVRMSLNDSYVPTDDGPVPFHAWGEVRADLDGASCVGAYGFSRYDKPADTGGALQLRCDDGTVVGAALQARWVPFNDDKAHWRLDLVDGFVAQQ
jgi:hypothetical protein